MSTYTQEEPTLGGWKYRDFRRHMYSGKSPTRPPPVKKGPIKRETLLQCLIGTNEEPIDRTIALVKAKANINAKDIVRVRWRMPAHLYCLSVSLCVRSGIARRWCGLLFVVIPISPSHYSKPRQTSTPNIKCVLVSPVGWLSLIHIWRCRRSTLCRSRWSPYH